MEVLLIENCFATTKELNWWLKNVIFTCDKNYPNEMQDLSDVTEILTIVKTNSKIRRLLTVFGVSYGGNKKKKMISSHQFHPWWAKYDYVTNMYHLQLIPFENGHKHINLYANGAYYYFYYECIEFPFNEGESVRHKFYFECEPPACFGHSKRWRATKVYFWCPTS